MKGSLKGVEGLYEGCCDGSFYEWALPQETYDMFTHPPTAFERTICMAPIWYNDAEALTLIEQDYQLNELDSTWRLTTFSTGTRDRRLPHRPYRTFNLESDDDLLVVKCKVRPVLLIKQVLCDWRVPNNGANLFSTWLCLPLFSYKPRHSQRYVIDDQNLVRPHHFYFPPGTPGIDEESVGKLIELQFIPERNLIRKTKMCDEKKMAMPFCLSTKAFNAVLGHLASFLPSIDVSGDAKEWYEFFAELVREQIPKLVT